MALSIAISKVESAPLRLAGVTSLGGLARLPSGESSMAISTINLCGLDKSAGSYQQFLICWRNAPARLPCNLEPEPRAFVADPADFDNCGARLPPAFTPLAFAVAAAISNIGEACPFGWGAGCACDGGGLRFTAFGAGAWVDLAVGGNCLGRTFGVGAASLAVVLGGNCFVIGFGVGGRGFGIGSGVGAASSIFGASAIGSSCCFISFAVSAISVSWPIVLATSETISTEIAGSGLVIGVTFHV